MLMLTEAIEGGCLSPTDAATSASLLAVLEAAATLHTSDHPAAIEMASLQAQISSWRAGSTFAGWERPAPTDAGVPDHVRQMSRRYDEQRSALLRAASELASDGRPDAEELPGRAAAEEASGGGGETDAGRAAAGAGGGPGRRGARARARDLLA